MAIRLRTCSATDVMFKDIMRKGDLQPKSVHNNYCTGRDCPNCTFDVYDDGHDRGNMYLKRLLEINCEHS